MTEKEYVKSLEKEIERLRELAYFDILTGFYNRNRLEEIRVFLDYENFDIAMVDVNNLKQVNDSEGHEAGDIHLKMIADKLKEKFMSIFRLGGDEFLIISGSKINEKELQDLDNLISYGIVNKTKDMSLREAMKLADERMYKDKERKKKQ